MQNGVSCKKIKYNLLNIHPHFIPEEQTIPPTVQSLTPSEQNLLLPKRKNKMPGFL